MAGFLVEIRLRGYAQDYGKAMIWDVAKKFRVRGAVRKPPVPHITLYGPGKTRDLRQVIAAIERVCRRYDPVPFTIHGFNYFGEHRNRVIYLDIVPSPELKELRRELAAELRKVSTCQKFDTGQDFGFHATVAFKDIDRKFDRIWDYVKKHEVTNLEQHAMRITIVGRGRRIVGEYDLALKRMLSRREALSERLWGATILVAAGEKVSNLVHSIPVRNGLWDDCVYYLGKLRNKFRRSVLRPVSRFLKGRWFLIILGLAIVFLSIAFYPDFLDSWPWRGRSYLRWMEIPLEAFGAMLVLIGVFVSRYRKRKRAINVSLLLALIVGGATYGYHEMDDSGMIDDWINRSSGEGTISGSLWNLIQESGGTQFIVVEDRDDDADKVVPDCEPELPEDVRFSPNGTIMLAGIGDTGITPRGNLVNARTFLREGVEEALADICVYPNEEGRAKIAETIRQDEETLKRQQEEAELARLIAEQERLIAEQEAEDAWAAAELERLREEQTKAALSSRVWVGNAYIVGGDYQPIIIVNNPDAKNPSWNQLTQFLKQDDTDKEAYIYSSFVCADFAEMLHNNAEAAGWRCAYISVQLSGYRDFANLGIPSNVGHALNAFETTDRGIVYVDCVRPVSGGVVSADKLVNVAVGKEYVPQSIFPQSGWSSTWGSMGTVTEIDGFQW